MIPGPNMLLVLSHGVRYGIRRTFGTMAGICLALILLTTVAATGIGAILAASETTFRILCIVGAVYLVFMGIAAWRTPFTHIHERQSGNDLSFSRDARSPLALGIQGFLVAISNPKGLAFSVAFLPQFIDASRPLSSQIIPLAVCIVTLESFWILVYALMGSYVLGMMARKGYGMLLNRISGSLLIVAAGLLLIH